MNRWMLLLGLTVVLGIVSDDCECGPSGDDDDDTGTDVTDSPSVDMDGDGFAWSDDCNDRDASIHPGAVEVCDGIDQDCDRSIDEGAELLWYPDEDADGYGDPSAEGVASCVQPYPEWVVAETGSFDCNDHDSTVHPGGTENCNGVNDDCDGETDEGNALATCYTDADGDGFGVRGDGPIASDSCTCPEGYGTIDDGADCNDADPSIYPAAPELCDRKDNDCNGEIDPDNACEPTPTPCDMTEQE